eukprot:397144-Pyramimonas_sp.AAC.1
MALAPLRTLTGLQVLHERSGFPCALPYGAVHLSMRLSHASFAGSPAGAVAAGAPAMAAESAASGICMSAVGVVVV